MGYPTGPLLKALAGRILGNLRFVEAATANYHPHHTQAPFSDTQLLISLLGVLVFPNERASEALANVISEYRALGDVVELRYTEAPAGRVFLPNGLGDMQLVDPRDLRHLARLLRHSIAHFNIRPIDEHGRFAGIRVWNEDRGRVTMVADLTFDALRPLAEYVLHALANKDHYPPIEDPEDPLERVRQQPPRSEVSSPPKLSQSVWDKYLEAYGGDAKAAHERLTRVLSLDAEKVKQEGKNQR